MPACKDIRGRINLYLDNELQGDDRRQFESHLRDCEACRTITHTERRFLDSVREARPLYAASPDLHARVRDGLRGPTTDQPLGRRRSLSTFVRPRVIVATAAATVLLFLLSIIVWRMRDRAPQLQGASSFALMAADTHLRHSRGQLPLEMTTTAPQEVSEWFANKVSFRVKIPNYQESSGQEKLYTLEGARLVALKNDYAAYVAYEMKGRPISLVITSDAVAKPSGGEEIKAKGLTFHYNAIQELKVLTWSDRGLTYALVSDLDERGQQSCIVCHQGGKDQDFIAPLKPR